MSESQKNKFNLDKQIKLKKVERENKKLGTK